MQVMKEPKGNPFALFPARLVSGVGFGLQLFSTQPLERLGNNPSQLSLSLVLFKANVPARFGDGTPSSTREHASVGAIHPRTRRQKVKQVSAYVIWPIHVHVHVHVHVAYSSISILRSKFRLQRGGEKSRKRARMILRQTTLLADNAISYTFSHLMCVCVRERECMTASASVVRGVAHIEGWRKGFSHIR